MDTNQLLAGGFVVGFVAAFWSKLKALVARLTSYLVVRVDVEDEAASATIRYAWTHFKPSPYGARRYKSYSDFVRPNRRHEAVGYQAVGKSPLVFWRGWRPIVFRFDMPTSNNTTFGHTPVLTVTFVRGTFDADELLAAALTEYNAARHSVQPTESRFRVVHKTGARYDRTADVFGRGVQAVAPQVAPETGGGGVREDRLLTWSKSDLGPVKPDDPLSAVAMTQDMADLVATAERWAASKSWYEEKRIPWRMGALCYGPPGTGKSILVRTMGQVLDFPVFAYDLSTYDNSQFAAAWQDMLGSAPCIALLEDIDAVFHGRENVTNGGDGGGLTFDCLLNLISGVGDASGILTVVTTNRIELLDEALGKPDPDNEGFSTRPGRIDRVVAFPPLDATGRRKIAARILSDCPEEIEPLVEKYPGTTGAQFEDACARVALEKFWAVGK